MFLCFENCLDNGLAIGGAATMKLGIRRSLWAFGLLQGLAGSSFAILAWMIFAVMTGGTEPLSVLTTVPEADKPYAMMFTAVCVENLCSGMATAAFVGFIMGLCDKRFTATQFALLTSLMALGGLAVQTPSGILAQAVGWPWYFVIGTVIMVPGLLLLTRFKAWQDGTPNREA